MIDDSRGVTSPIEYVLTFAIAGILIIGLVIAATGQVESQRSRTVQAQMDVVGQQIAGSLEVADRRIASGASSMTLNREVPNELLGQQYTVTVESDAIIVESPVAESSLRVPYETDAPVQSTPKTLNGGEIVIEYSGSQLVIDNV